MARKEFSDEQRKAAYEYARRRIAEVRAAGGTSLDLGSGERRKLTAPLSVIPEEIADLSELAFLNLQGTQIDDLLPLQQLSKLQTLSLDRTRVTSLSPIAGLGELRRIYLNGTDVTDVQPLLRLDSLQRLSLARTKVEDLAPLLRLNRLEVLHLDEAPVTDLTPLSELGRLRSLFLNDTQVSDLTPLRGAIGLQTLSLNRSKVLDLAPLRRMGKLWRLNLDDSPVEDLLPLQRCFRLRHLRIRNTFVSDLRPLFGLRALLNLDIDGTQVADLLPLAGLSMLGAGGLWFSDTPAAERDEAHIKLAAIEDPKERAKQMLLFLTGRHPSFGGPPEPFVQSRLDPSILRYRGQPEQNLEGRIRINLRGRFSVEDDLGNDLTPRSAKACGLLLLLALGPGVTRSRTWLQEKLWSDRDATQASGNLRQLLAEIRHAFEPNSGVLKATRQSVSLNQSSAVIDESGEGELAEGLEVKDLAFSAWIAEMRKR